MKYSVTHADINNGKKGSNRTCPISLAIRRILPGHDIVIGCLRLHIFKGRDCVVRRDTTEEEFTFINNFDRSIPVQPFEGEVGYESP